VDLGHLVGRHGRDDLAQGLERVVEALGALTFSDVGLRVKKLS
jgi:hypothetical protein